MPAPTITSHSPAIEEKPSNQAALTAISHSLRQTELFKRLDSPSLSKLAQLCRIVKLPKNGILFHEGEVAQGFYIVHTGSISLSRISIEGKEQVISLFRPHDCFAEATLSTLETYPATASALEPTQVILVSKKSFRSFIAERPDLAMSMLASMSLHLKHLVQMIEDLKFKQIECRLANWLLRQLESESDIVNLPFSKKVLASRLGVTSETLSRAFARFRKEGLITVNTRDILIEDREGLSAYLREL
ncbi:Crp/Fnr family transcriptional regulator [Pelagicoccus sp. SDUM812005]|uniref:Crp/Fnr family transcriptional regulator n=1 Tax=Pelagicoccus sp. SDUM812005 TaxID=3041257 RepID=UPI00280D4CD8|nr:Crp/Fnr family transcriptional regulator [Pelagicoccus sp. SDUM812005]MDQ8182286.1 Crp/Fnr family transcriptional regulator [Pelagicoccus sp. SDUM812005]